MFTILAALALLLIAFLIMITVQMIRVEKEIERCSNIVDVYVKKMYHRT